MNSCFCNYFMSCSDLQLCTHVHVHGAGRRIALRSLPAGVRRPVPALHFCEQPVQHNMQGSLVGADEDYRSALDASALFWHAQRSGTFTDTLVPWRGNSGLSDVPVGGFYEGSSAQRDPVQCMQAACAQASRMKLMRL